MKFFVSVDMEGISGLVDWNDPQEKISKYMTQEVKAVLNGVFSCDPQAEILICDAHSSGNNLNILDLPVNITLIQGRTRPFYMVEGYDSSFDGAFLIGYHAPVGTLKGLMDHSYSSSSFFEVTINGQVVGEAEINALLLAEEDIPVLMITGDDQLKLFSQTHFPDTHFVITKRSIGKFSAELTHPDKIHHSIEKVIPSLIENRKQYHKYELAKPYFVEITLINTFMADYASLIPGIDRPDGRKLTFVAENVKTMYRYMMSILMISAASKQ